MRRGSVAEPAVPHPSAGLPHPLAAADVSSPKCPGEKGSTFVNNRSRNPKDGGFVGNGADVSESAFIAPSAAVCGSAIVSGRARITGDAVIRGEAEVRGQARVFGNAVVEGSAIVQDSARVSGNARIHGDAVVGGDAVVRGEARIDTGTVMTGVLAPKKSKAEAEREAQAAGEKALEGFTTYTFASGSPTSTSVMMRWKRRGECAAQVSFEETMTARGRKCGVWKHTVTLPFANITAVDVKTTTADLTVSLKKTYRSAQHETTYYGVDCQSRYKVRTRQYLVGSTKVPIHFDHQKHKALRARFLAAFRAKVESCRAAARGGEAKYR